MMVLLLPDDEDIDDDADHDADGNDFEFINGG